MLHLRATYSFAQASEGQHSAWGSGGTSHLCCQLDSLKNFQSVFIQQVNCDRCEFFLACLRSPFSHASILSGEIRDYWATYLS